MQASAVLRDVARDLNDYDGAASFVRWTQAQLLSYLQEAVVELSAFYDSLFQKTVVVRLRPGVWQTACDCTHIQRVIGESTADGTVLRELREMADSNETIWPGDDNLRCALIELDSPLHGFSVSKTQDNKFRVFPPVPVGVTKYALVECTHQPTAEEMDVNYDVPDRIVAAVKQWMLYRALIVDSETNSAMTQIANTHLQTYQNLVRGFVVEIEKRKEREDANSGSVRAAQGSDARKVSS